MKFIKKPLEKTVITKVYDFEAIKEESQYAVDEMIKGGMTGLEIAEACGVSNVHISRIKNGHNKVQKSSVPKLLKIINYFNNEFNKKG